MNHIYADREALIRAWIGLIAFTLLTVLFSIVAASSDSVAALIIALIFFLGDLVSLRVLNRGAARICLSDNTLTRRGYLAGFSKTIPTDTITRVVHIESKLFGNRLYLIDEAAAHLDAHGVEVDRLARGQPVQHGADHLTVAFAEQGDGYVVAKCVFHGVLQNIDFGIWGGKLLFTTCGGALTRGCSTYANRVPRWGVGL